MVTARCVQVVRLRVPTATRLACVNVAQLNLLLLRIVPHAVANLGWILTVLVPVFALQMNTSNKIQIPHGVALHVLQALSSPQEGTPKKLANHVRSKVWMAAGVPTGIRSLTDSIAHARPAGT